MTATPSNAGSRSRGARTTQILARWRQWLPAAEVRVDLVFSRRAGASRPRRVQHDVLRVRVAGRRRGRRPARSPGQPPGRQPPLAGGRHAGRARRCLPAAGRPDRGPRGPGRRGAAHAGDRRGPGVDRRPRLEDVAHLAAADRRARPVDGAAVPLRAGRGGRDLHGRPPVATLVCGAPRPAGPARPEHRARHAHPRVGRPAGSHVRAGGDRVVGAADRPRPADPAGRRRAAHPGHHRGRPAGRRRGRRAVRRAAPAGFGRRRPHGVADRARAAVRREPVPEPAGRVPQVHRAERVRAVRQDAVRGGRPARGDAGPAGHPRHLRRLRLGCRERRGRQCRRRRRDRRHRRRRRRDLPPGRQPHRRQRPRPGGHGDRPGRPGRVRRRLAPDGRGRHRHRLPGRRRPRHRAGRLPAVQRRHQHRGGAEHPARRRRIPAHRRDPDAAGRPALRRDRRRCPDRRHPGARVHGRQARRVERAAVRPVDQGGRDRQGDAGRGLHRRRAPREYQNVFLPGHSLARLQRFVRAEQLAGDDEQYAAALALAANRLGIQSRVVFGATPEASGEVKGSDIHAWVEVHTADGTWAPMLPRDFLPDRNKQPEQQQQRSEEQKTGAQVPPPVANNPPSVLQGPDQAQNATQNRKPPPPNPLDPSTWPDWVEWRSPTSGCPSSSCCSCMRPCGRSRPVAGCGDAPGVSPARGSRVAGPSWSTPPPTSGSGSPNATRLEQAVSLDLGSATHTPSVRSPSVPTRTVRPVGALARGGERLLGRGQGGPKGAPAPSALVAAAPRRRLAQLAASGGPRTPALRRGRPRAGDAAPRNPVAPGCISRVVLASVGCGSDFAREGPR